MTQKILKIGSEAGIKLTKTSLRKLGLKIGDAVRVVIGEPNQTVAIEPSVVIDREVLEWTKKFIKKYRPALEALSKK